MTGQRAEAWHVEGAECDKFGFHWHDTRGRAHWPAFVSDPPAWLGLRPVDPPPPPAQRSRPDHVDILGQRFSIVWANVGLDALIESVRAGSCNRTTQTIYINHQAPDQLRETLLHELIHAIGGIHGLAMAEADVAPLSAGLYQALRANPELAAFLLNAAAADDLPGAPSAERWRQVRDG